MKAHGHFTLLRYGVALMLILLAGGLLSCTATLPADTHVPVSTLRVVMDNNYPPYVFEDAQGNVRGILVDQWKLWEERSGVKVVISALPWSEALERMKAGEFDVIDTIFYTDERAQLFDFTPPFARIDVAIFFQNNISGIADAEDLKGFRVAVKSGDANADYLARQGITDLTYYTSYEEIVQAAARREETIFVMDQPSALYFLYKYGIHDQFNHSDPLYSGEFHRAVARGNSAVLNLVTEGFSRISRAEYQAIDQHWLGAGESDSLQRLIPYLVLGAFLVLLVILVLTAFSWMLRRRVRQRTTELEEALAALHDNRRFLADLIEFSGAVIFVKDLEGHYELVNRKWETVTGVAREDAVGKTDAELFSSSLAQQFREHDLAVLESGHVLEIEELFEDAQGKRSFISIKFPLHDETGRIKGICGMATEITERKRAESQREAALEALAESEEIFRLFMEHSPIYVFFKDEQTRSLRLSKNYEQMLGRPLPELLGKTMDELFPSDLARSMTTDDLRILREGKQIDVVEELDGRVYKTTKFPIIRPGRPSWLAGYTIDITDSTRAAEALRQSEDKFSKAFHTSPDSININRLRDGLYLEINEGFTAMTGYTSEDVRGKTSLELNIWVDSADRARLAQGLRERGEVSNLEAAFRMKDGRVVTGLMSARIIEVAGEKCILSITRDITERKRAEAEIMQLNQELEWRVAERTRELAEANARLTELDQLKSKFVSDVSHELRTPIANLKLYIDLLERGRPDKQAQYVQVLHQQIRRVAALVDDILDLSRLERRKEQGTSYRAVALNDVIDQVVLAHQPRAEADGLMLTFEPAPQLPPVLGDANQLAQVTTNLIANALSYTTAGSIRVSTSSQDKQVCLCVADSGSGIPEEDLPHIFDRFYRGHLVLKNDIPGTGLGLAIVKEIVDLHRGSIEVDSLLGQGTTFRVWLPASEELAASR